MTNHTFTVPVVLYVQRQLSGAGGPRTFSEKASLESGIVKWLKTVKMSIVLHL